MVSNLSIKDVPEAWAEILRQRAARNHRSLQGELMRIIERAVSEADSHAAGSLTLPTALHPFATSVDALAPGGAVRSTVQRGWKTLEQLTAERRAQYPKPIHGVPLGVDLVRAERDGR